MGLKASNTCELAFGAHGVPAQGWLLGDVHDGIRQMFHVIRHARMMVGTKAMATLSTGYLNALGYARDPGAGGRPPPARRQDGAARSRSSITRTCAGRWRCRRRTPRACGPSSVTPPAGRTAAGWPSSPATPRARERPTRVNDLLLPLVKGCGSERAYELLGHESLQTLGGSGYLQDYPIEQYVRDSKIDTLYEGTTAIQSLDLVFRKVAGDGGTALRTLTGEIESFLDAQAGNGQLKEERLALAAALADVRGMLDRVTAWLTAAAGGSRRRCTRLACRRAGCCSPSVTSSSAGCSSARRRSRSRPSGGATVSAADRAFYTGKVASARFFAREVLPQTLQRPPGRGDTRRWISWNCRRSPSDASGTRGVGGHERGATGSTFDPRPSIGVHRDAAGTQAFGSGHRGPAGSETRTGRGCARREGRRRTRRPPRRPASSRSRTRRHVQWRVVTHRRRSSGPAPRPARSAGPAAPANTGPATARYPRREQPGAGGGGVGVAPGSERPVDVGQVGRLGRPWRGA